MLCERCKGNVRPIVCLDVDNTLGNWTGHFFDFLRMYWNLSAEEWLRLQTYDGSVELSEFLGVSKRVYQDAKTAFRAGGYKRWMKFMGDGAVAALRESLDPCEVWITTTRPWGRLDNIDVDLREWLHRKEIRYDHILFGQHKYSDLVDQVDDRRIVFMMDDDGEMYDVADALGLPIYLRKTNWNRAIQRPREIRTMATAAHTITRNIQLWRGQHGH